MAEISKIKLGDVSYDLKDAVARQTLEGLSGAMHFLGTTTTALSEGSSVTSLSIEGKDGNVTPVSGDVVIYDDLEYVFNGKTWNKFGPAGNFGALAFKSKASGSVTPVGTNASSAVTLTGGSTGKMVTTSIKGVAGTTTVHDTPTPTTKSLKGVSGTTTTHDTPTLTKSSVGSASGWSAGKMFTAAVSGEELVLTAGTAPQLTVTPTDVGTGLTAGAAVTVPVADASATTVVTGLTEGDSITVATAASNATTVATGTVSSDGAGSTVATALPTGGTAAAQKFTGSASSVTVQ